MSANLPSLRRAKQPGQSGKYTQSPWAPYGARDNSGCYHFILSLATTGIETNMLDTLLQFYTWRYQTCI